MTASTRPSDPLRVLFLSDHLGHPEGRVHGATTYFLQVLPRLTRAGVDLTVCFLRERHPVADRLEAAGVRPRFLHRGRWDPRAYSDVRRIIRQHDVHLIHAAGMKGILIGRAAARSCRRPVIAHLHDRNDPGPLLAWLHRRTAGSTSRVLAISDAVAEFGRTRLGLPADWIETLYNGIDLDAFADPDPDGRRRVRDQLGLPMDAPVVAAIGRLTREKGQDILLRAWPRLVEARPDTRLLVVGDGPERPACEALAASLGIQGSVRFLGSRDDVPDLLAAADVVAIPSREEGLSYVALEAMAAGVPVAAFATGGLREVLADDQTGRLAPAEDGAALVDAVRSLVEDPLLARRLVHAARDAVRAYSIDLHVARLVAIYRDVAGGVP